MAHLEEQDDTQQVSFHFWKCQLSAASPRYSWDPENWAVGKREHCHLRCHGDGGCGEEKAKELKATEDSDKKESDVAETGHANGKSNGHANTDGSVHDSDGDGVSIKPYYTDHVLKVNACVLGPRAPGVHLISVRTKGYQSEQPDTCPIVCIDPASQRTLTLGYEFVLDSQNEVTFELTEGEGPVWLTGLHQVRVHETIVGDDDDYSEDGEAADEASEDSDEEGRIDETSRFRLADAKDGGDEGEEEEVEEELMEEGDGEDAEGDEGKKSVKSPGKPGCMRSPITTAQLRNRKRQRLENGKEGNE